MTSLRTSILRISLRRTGRATASVWCVAALVALVPPCLFAQASVPQRLDEGSFTIVVRGQRVGREQFSVQQRTGVDGAVVELRAESATGDRRTAMRLEADSAGTPVRYTVEERQGTEQTLRLGGQRVRGRFTTLMVCWPGLRPATLNGVIHEGSVLPSI